MFIVVPQLLVANVMGTIMQAFFPTEPIWTSAFRRHDEGQRRLGRVAAGAGHGASQVAGRSLTLR